MRPDPADGLLLVGLLPHPGGMIRKRAQRSFDHRLVRLVQETGDITIATKLGVPRSTAAGWVRRARKPVMNVPELDSSPKHLPARVLRLERRLRLCSPSCASSSPSFRACTYPSPAFALPQTTRLASYAPSNALVGSCVFAECSELPDSRPRGFTPGEGRRRPASCRTSHRVRALRRID